MATEKEILKFYKDSIEITFYPNSHQYKLNGENIDSASRVSGILDKSQALLPWAKNSMAEDLILKGTGQIVDIKKVLKGDQFLNREDTMQLTVEDVIDSINASDKLKDKACDVGSTVHGYAEEYGKAMIKLQLPPIVDFENLSDQAKSGINAFQNFVLVNNVDFIECEKRLYSKELNIVGITDVIAIVNDRKLIIDYKTAKYVYDEHKIQGCIYRKAYIEEYGENVGVGIAHFDKETGEFGFYELSPREIDLYTIQAVNLNNALKTKKLIDNLNK